MSVEKKNNNSPKKRRYEKPAVTDSARFETLATMCGKDTVDGFGPTGPTCMGGPLSAS